MRAALLTSLAILLGAVTIWLRLVNQKVPQPYLDEFFHIPQAQKYCAGQWTSWDSKITTPPGLYLIAAGLRSLLGCSISTLRLENALCLVALLCVTWLLSQDGPDAQRAHTALNIALFPPLFFFSTLYYTDVPSTLSVLLFHACWKSKVLKDLTPSTQRGTLGLLGIASLFFRQTNIFWVAIYPAIVTAIDALDSGPSIARQSMHDDNSGFGDSWANIVKTCWRFRLIYDQPVGKATISDYAKCIVSVIVSTIKASTDLSKLLQLLTVLSPFIGLLLAFVSFVAWNGSVVLGDKSNHVATLHLPQMLYLWPYILFFSWPIMIPTILSTVLGMLPASLRKHIPTAEHWTQMPPRPLLQYWIMFATLAAPIIRYNTIVHPFTLADNRHYTFYVFRLLMRPWWIRYAAVPVYALCAWLCVQALGDRQAKNETHVSKAAVSRQAVLSRQHESQAYDQIVNDSAPSTAASVPRPENASTNTTSRLLAWLLTSALQLITAPLVEPRYFILPWIFWRLSVADATHDSGTDRQRSVSQRRDLSVEVLADQRLLLWLETAWYMVINIVTGYIFLQWIFAWSSEPGQLQRFMW